MAEAARMAAQAELNQIKEMVARKDIRPIHFASAGSDLLGESFQVLDLVAQTAAKYPNLELRVAGHTDSVGKDIFNLRISQRRAEAANDGITQKGRLSADQVIAVGAGEAWSLADSGTAQARDPESAGGIHFHH